MGRSQKNFLDMVPVRNVAEFRNEGDRTALMIPKFKSKWLRKWFIPARRSEYIKIYLDETGSKVWNLIDGIKNTNDICAELYGSFPENSESANQMDQRVTRFLRELYKNRFIIFRK